jgi:hypothetical protein
MRAHQVYALLCFLVALTYHTTASYKPPIGPGPDGARKINKLKGAGSHRLKRIERALEKKQKNAAKHARFLKRQALESYVSKPNGKTPYVEELDDRPVGDLNDQAVQAWERVSKNKRVDYLDFGAASSSSGSNPGSRRTGLRLGAKEKLHALDNDGTYDAAPDHYAQNIPDCDEFHPVEFCDMEPYLRAIEEDENEIDESESGFHMELPSQRQGKNCVGWIAPIEGSKFASVVRFDKPVGDRTAYTMAIDEIVQRSAPSTGIKAVVNVDFYNVLGSFGRNSTHRLVWLAQVLCKEYSLCVPRETPDQIDFDSDIDMQQDFALKFDNPIFDFARVSDAARKPLTNGKPKQEEISRRSFIQNFNKWMRSILVVNSVEWAYENGFINAVVRNLIISGQLADLAGVLDRFSDERNSKSIEEAHTSGSKERKVLSYLGYGDNRDEEVEEANDFEDRRAAQECEQMTVDYRDCLFVTAVYEHSVRDFINLLEALPESAREHFFAFILKREFKDNDDFYLNLCIHDLSACGLPVAPRVVVSPRGGDQYRDWMARDRKSRRRKIVDEKNQNQFSTNSVNSVSLESTFFRIKDVCQVNISNDFFPGLYR